MSKYALLINEATLDLVQVLNSGGRPEIEDDTYLVFDAVPPNTTENHDIVTEDSLYDKRGYPKDEHIVLVMGS